VKFIKEFDGAYDGLIRGALVPERIETQSNEILIESKRYSDELQCPLRLHAAQGTDEFFQINKRFSGKTAIQALNSIGFLGPRTLIPHAIWLAGSWRLPFPCEGDDLGLMRETGTSIIHCPIAWIRGGIATESFGRYRQAGVNIALGTDTHPPDIIHNIQVGSYLARLMDRKQKGNDFVDFYRAATSGGAKALGRNDIGRLSPGALADIIVIDISNFYFGVYDDPIQTFFLSGSGRDVKKVIINGRIVMQNREIIGIDLSALQRHAQENYQKIHDSYLYRSWEKHTPEELWEPSLKVIKRND
jgi:5-methylthioadenosine/S-adenosylhomocysteine deaminase